MKDKNTHLLTDRIIKRQDRRQRIKEFFFRRKTNKFKNVIIKEFLKQCAEPDKEFTIEFVKFKSDFETIKLALERLQAQGEIKIASELNYDKNPNWVKIKLVYHTQDDKGKKSKTIARGKPLNLRTPEKAIKQLKSPKNDKIVDEQYLVNVSKNALKSEILKGPNQANFNKSEQSDKITENATQETKTVTEATKNTTPVTKLMTSQTSVTKQEDEDDYYNNLDMSESEVKHMLAEDDENPFDYHKKSDDDDLLKF